MKRPSDPAIRFFTQRLRERIPTEIRDVILFGSRARGDAGPGSDYDFAVILYSKKPETVHAVRETEIEFLDRFDSLCSALIYDAQEWEERKGLPIGLNIAREGIAL